MVFNHPLGTEKQLYSWTPQTGQRELKISSAGVKELDHSMAYNNLHLLVYENGTRLTPVARM